jgi:hypothetical protein
LLKNDSTAFKVPVQIGLKPRKEQIFNLKEQINSHFWKLWSRRYHQSENYKVPNNE